MVTEDPKTKYAVPYYEIPYEKFFQFGMSVDSVVFGYHNSQLKVLLIKRGAPPFQGMSALPGDLVYPNETIEVAAHRILRDLTGVDEHFIQQTKVYSAVDRHPVARVITTGVYSLINISKHDPHASAWADGVDWVSVDECPPLAFDHDQILKDALIILRDKVRREPVGFELLPKKFVLGDLQELYEGLLNIKFDKANFRKRMLSTKILKDLNELQEGVPHRPARLYSFNREKYEELESTGFSIQI